MADVHDQRFMDVELAASSAHAGSVLPKIISVTTRTLSSVHRDGVNSRLHNWDQCRWTIGDEARVIARRWAWALPYAIEHAGIDVAPEHVGAEPEGGRGLAGAPRQRQRGRVHRAEHGLIAAGIGVAILTVVNSVGGSLVAIFTTVSNDIATSIQRSMERNKGVSGGNGVPMLTRLPL